MEKMVTKIFCISIHTLKLALAVKNQLKCIDNTRGVPIISSTNISATDRVIFTTSVIGTTIT